MSGRSTLLETPALGSVTTRAVTWRLRLDVTGQVFEFPERVSVQRDLLGQGRLGEAGASGSVPGAPPARYWRIIAAGLPTAPSGSHRPASSQRTTRSRPAPPTRRFASAGTFGID